jgi:hypothetical protein
LGQIGAWNVVRGRLSDPEILIFRVAGNFCFGAVDSRLLRHHFAATEEKLDGGVALEIQQRKPFSCFSKKRSIVL